MPQKPSKLIRLWQELKRRKVFRVLTIYAATAYIIIELVNNLIGPLLLPEWTATLIVSILVLGLPVVVILSWIYDITSEGIIKTESETLTGEKKTLTKHAKRRLSRNDIVIAVLLVMVAILVWPKIFSRNKTDTEMRANDRVSVAVLPFQNMTNDTTWNKWQTAIQTDLITSLSNSEELKVKQKESINSLLQSSGYNNYTSITPPVANRVSKKLGATMFIYGSIKQSGTIIRLNAQLYDTKTKDDIKSFHVDGTTENILHFIDSLSFMVKNYLIIAEMQKEVPAAFQQLVSTDSHEVYSFFAYGYGALKKFDYSTAAQWLSQAVEYDSSLTFATALLSFSYARQGRYEEAKECCLRAFEKKDQMPLQLQIWTDYIYALTFETPQEEIKYLKQLQEIDDQLPEFYYYKGTAYNSLHQFDKAIPELEKALKKYEKLYSKPFWSPVYAALGLAYHKTGQVKKEKELYKKSEKDFPRNLLLTGMQAILAFNENDTIEVNKYIDRYVSLCKENLLREPVIAANIAEIYSDAGIPGKAEEYYKEALSLEPENPGILNSLACLLIDNDLKINKGIELIDKALELSPDNYSYLHTKGRGLYKQGKYEEALKLLEKSWEYKPVYDHGLYLHLEEAKKAIVNQ